MVVVTVSRVLIRKHKLRHRVLRVGYTCSNDVSMIDRIDTTTTTSLPFKVGNHRWSIPETAPMVDGYLEPCEDNQSALETLMLLV